MEHMEKDDIIRSYVCISDDTTGGLMQVLGIVNSYDEAQLTLFNHLRSDCSTKWTKSHHTHL